MNDRRRGHLLFVSAALLTAFVASGIGGWHAATTTPGSVLCEAVVGLLP